METPQVSKRVLARAYQIQLTKTQLEGIMLGRLTVTAVQGFFPSHKLSTKGGHADPPRHAKCCMPEKYLLERTIRLHVEDEREIVINHVNTSQDLSVFAKPQIPRSTGRETKKQGFKDSRGLSMPYAAGLFSRKGKYGQGHDGLLAGTKQFIIMWGSSHVIRIQKFTQDVRGIQRMPSGGVATSKMKNAIHEMIRTKQHRAARVTRMTY
ncbi:hypothetical protein RUM43_001616 [Polyplax serrata]|uniref:Uncharacterized protein n=1 Tax=Polyplax serrata TaxID=468196 RepID=A0AAN8XR13_POLSC